MNDIPKNNQESELLEHDEHELLESKISEQLVLEHPSYKQLSEQLEQATQQSGTYHEKLLRLQAELENYRKRAERDIAHAHKYAIEKFAYEILIIVDNLERSLTTKISDNTNLKDFYAGIELTLQSLLAILDKFSITVIDPLGETFNHEKHTAITTKEEPTAQPNTIVEVIQKGYWFKDRLLRPALVVVAKGKD